MCSIKWHVEKWYLERERLINMHLKIGKLLATPKYIKCVLLPLTEVVGPIMNLISGTHNFCERKEYAFNVLTST